MKHNLIVIYLQITFDGIRKCVKFSKDQRNLSINLIKCILGRHIAIVFLPFDIDDM